jgi:uncharacterized membrane protein YcaP (DUF421 family)
MTILPFPAPICTLTHFFPGFHRWACNQPFLLMENGTFLDGNLRKAKLSRPDVIAKLREASVLHLSEVRAVVFESNGGISVLRGSQDQDLDGELLEDVKFRARGQ